MTQDKDNAGVIARAVEAQLDCRGMPGIAKEKEHDEMSCPFCKGTGVMKYKEIDEFASRNWVPWSEEPCLNGCKLHSNAGAVR